MINCKFCSYHLTIFYVFFLYLIYIFQLILFLVFLLEYFILLFFWPRVPYSFIQLRNAEFQGMSQVKTPMLELLEPMPNAFSSNSFLQYLKDNIYAFLCDMKIKRLRGYKLYLLFNHVCIYIVQVTKLLLACIQFIC